MYLYKYLAKFRIVTVLLQVYCFRLNVVVFYVHVYSMQNLQLDFIFLVLSWRI